MSVVGYGRYPVVLKIFGFGYSVDERPAREPREFIF